MGRILPGHLDAIHPADLFPGLLESHLGIDSDGFLDRLSPGPAIEDEGLASREGR